ncbi:MAG: methyltransferase domain-containing protein [Streptosporangiales bacterium]|nr:methyltransferase domain-containing protein [Streptosporangiales bacterium]
MPRPTPEIGGDHQRLMRYWDRHARSYDREMRFFDRHLFGESRAWICAQASGEVLEVAIGTGLNLPLYADDVRLTGIEWSPAMLAIARDRANRLGRTVALQQADAQALPFDDASFDTVVCTLSLCAIPDDRRAVAEMTRVLRPGGRLLLLDHVASSAWPVRVLQRLLELVTVPLGGEHFLRRPLHHVRGEGFRLDHHRRVKLGVVECLVARRPSQP